MGCQFVWSPRGQRDKTSGGFYQKGQMCQAGDLESLMITIRNHAFSLRTWTYLLQEVLIAHPLPIPLFPKSYLLETQVFNINRLFSRNCPFWVFVAIPWSLGSSDPSHQVTDQIAIGNLFAGLPSPEQFSLWENQPKLSKMSSGSWILLPSAWGPSSWRSSLDCWNSWFSSC